MSDLNFLGYRIYFLCGAYEIFENFHAVTGLLKFCKPAHDSLRGILAKVAWYASKGRIKLKVGFDSWDSVKKTHKPFSINAMKFTRNLLKSAKILKNIETLTRTSCMSTIGHKQEFSMDKIQQFSSLKIFQLTSDSGSLDKLCVCFFPNLCFVFALAHTSLKNFGIKTDFQFYTA